MTNNVLNVPIAELIAASNQFQAMLDEMRGRLSGLEDFMADRIKTWDGASKTAYAQLQTEWQAGAQQLHGVGQDFAGAILHSGQKFTQAEERNLEAIARTRSSFS
ncbi:WXG100 family type VII secretion target [Hamadaea sp. NPDC051192]|uniref:WXG100 family type VII secretion target n=1 Tax=Hamadaea sp. NPDC051192 TaxID=3154940 RepID=UPI003425CCDB